MGLVLPDTGSAVGSCLVAILVGGCTMSLRGCTGIKRGCTGICALYSSLSSN